MGLALVTNQIDEDAGLADCLSTEDARDFFAKAPPLLTIGGMQPLPGESWRGYNQRVEARLVRKVSPATAPRLTSPSRPGAVCITALAILVTVILALLIS